MPPSLALVLARGENLRGTAMEPLKRRSILSARKIKVGSRKIDLEEQLPSLYERMKTWVEENPYPVLGVMAVVLLVSIGAWGVGRYGESREKKVQTEYTHILRTWPTDEASDPKDMEKVVLELEKVVALDQGRKSIQNARLDLARGYCVMHRYEDALRLARMVLDETAPQSGLKPFARYQLALTYGAAGKVEEALEQWKLLKAQGPAGLHREADWQLARLYAGKSQFIQGVEAYEAALKASGNYPTLPQLQDELASVKGKVASLDEATPQGEGLKKEQR